MIRFAASANPATVSAHARDVVERILRASGNADCTVTSTTRSPGEQARVMYENLQAFGVRAQRGLYRVAGNRVIDAYERATGVTKAERIAAMESAILAVGPGNVSRHCANPAEVCVLDIAPRSLAHAAEFRAAAERDPAVTRVLGPPSDPAFHLEIPAPGVA